MTPGDLHGAALEVYGDTPPWQRGQGAREWLSELLAALPAPGEDAAAPLAFVRANAELALLTAELYERLDALEGKPAPELERGTPQHSARTLLLALDWRLHREAEARPDVAELAGSLRSLIEQGIAADTARLLARPSDFDDRNGPRNLLGALVARWRRTAAAHAGASWLGVAAQELAFILPDLDERDSRQQAALAAGEHAGNYAVYAALERDALRWRTLASLGRIRTLGWAGMGGKKDGYARTDDGLHLGLELWNTYPGISDEDRAASRHILTTWVDHVTAAREAQWPTS